MSRPRIFATEAEAQAANRRTAAEQSRRRSLSLRELNRIPAVENPERRAACENNLQLFLETYGTSTFTSPWSEAHLELIRSIQTAVETPGQQLCSLLPRGFGKTSIAIWSLIWAALYGKSPYQIVIGAALPAAKQVVANARNILLYNPAFGDLSVTPDSDDTNIHTFGDFPEAIYPLRKIGTQAARAAGQMLNGLPTECKLSASIIQFPFTDNAPCRGCVIEAAGLTGSLRGRNITNRRGSLRPTLALIDDCQTDKSAKSFEQTTQRLNLLEGSIAGLAAADTSCSIVGALTIIEEDDLPSRLLDKPEWNVVRYGVLDKLPTGEALELWDQYNRLRLEGLTDNLSAAELSDNLNTFYQNNQAVLEASCAPTWEAFRDPGYTNSRQKCMRLYYEKPHSFWREYQNNPAAEVKAQQKATLSHPALITKIIPGNRRSIAPIEVERITIGSDSQTLGIYWVAIGWTADGTGYVIDYDKYPRGRRTITSLFKGNTLDQSLYLGYTDLKKAIFDKAWTRDDGAQLKADTILIDCGYGPAKPKLYQFLHDAGDTRLFPSFGRTSVTGSVFSSKRKPGERRGDGWSLAPASFVRGQGNGRISQPRHVVFDANFFKSQLSSRVAASPGIPGGLSFFMDTEAGYQDYFTQLTAEKPVTVTSARIGTVESWQLIPNRLNHYLDSTVLALVSAAMQGVGTGGGSIGINTGGVTRHRVKGSDLQRQKRQQKYGY